MKVFLDNLRLHHSRDFVEYAKQIRMDLIFNASYSSEVNPIERLWAFSKRLFSYEVVAESDWKNQGEIDALVRYCILKVDSDCMRKHVQYCYLRMVTELNQIK